MRWIFLIVFIIFSAFSTWVTFETSYWNAFPPFNDLNTTQIFWDLVNSASIALFLLYLLAKEKRRPIKPILLCAVATIFLGSIAILGYLVYDSTIYSREI